VLRPTDDLMATGRRVKEGHLGARVVECTKQTGASVVLTEATRTLERSDVELDRRASLKLKGVSGPGALPCAGGYLQLHFGRTFEVRHARAHG